MRTSRNRRRFLRDTGLLLAAMHVEGWSGSHTLKASTASQGPPVEFLRLRLRATQPPALRDFYSRILQLPVDEAPGSLRVQAGTTELVFDAHDGGANPFYHFAFNIPENKLGAAITWMKDRASLIPHPSTGRQVFDYPKWNANSIYFYDPAGNILEFIARHSLENAAPGDFGSGDILYASEIGMVVPDVTRAIAELKNKLGVADYIGVSNVFAPIGNEHGLFIVVDADRKWFERIPAGMFPAEVRLRGGRSGSYVISSSGYRIEAVDAASQ